MRQVVFASFSTVPGDHASLDRIVEQSRHNNALDGITGLLWSDSFRYLQVFEGPRGSMEACFNRICSDSRHHSLEVVSDRTTDHRDFGTWHLLHRRADDSPNVHDALMRMILSEAPDTVQRYFANQVAPRPKMSLL